MKRLALFFALAIFPASADAQTVQTADPGSDADALVVEIDRDWAQLQAADCDTACRALDSMRRATDRLCALDPGDRCARARQKLTDAWARVRSACPSCAEATGNVAPEADAAKSAPAPASNVVAEETVQKKSGGCSGCAVAPEHEGAAGALSLALAATLLARRRRRSGSRARERRAP